MKISTTELAERREWAYQTHRKWKARSETSDRLVQGDWKTVWPDMTVEDMDPVVEDVYTEALTDKVATISGVEPFLDVAPARGTREDLAERNAQKRRRAFVTFMRDSYFDKKHAAWATDLLQHGAGFSIPWVDWSTGSKFPYTVRMDPRHAYPLTHDPNGELTAILFVKRRRLFDVRKEYQGYEALSRLEAFLANRGEPETIEELWYMDEDHWGVGLSVAVDEYKWYRYVPPRWMNEQSGQFNDWLIEPHEHRLDGCPAVEMARQTPDGEYRGLLDPMIPNLRTAQNIVVRLLDDLDRQIFAPQIAQNVADLDAYGPDIILEGKEGEQVNWISTRQPMNLEGMQHAATQLDAARNVGFQPQQRAGDPGASIASGKATNALQGSFNSTLGWSQRDLQVFYRQTLGRLANFDEQWCGGERKQIDGWDEGERYTERYDPAKFWKEDYRVQVRFHNLGLDQHNALITLGVMRQYGAMSTRTLMTKSGMIDNVLAEERDMALEDVSTGLRAFIFQQADNGNPEPMMLFAQEIDDDKASVREASMKVIRQLTGAAGGDGAGGGPQPQAGAGGDALLQMRSLEQGGVPGRAAGLPPPVRPGLQAMLPAGAQRGVAEVGPGASGP